MAARCYGPGWQKVLAQEISPLTDTLKVMLVDDTYTMDPDQEFLDDGGPADPSSHEISATNYAGGFAGAGRKTATVTSQYNETEHRTEFALADLTWTALGGVTNDTIGGAILYVHDTSDAASSPLVWFDFDDVVTNGADLVLDFLSLAAGGNIRLTV